MYLPAQYSGKLSQTHTQKFHQTAGRTTKVENVKNTLDAAGATLCTKAGGDRQSSGQGEEPRAQAETPDAQSSGDEAGPTKALMEAAKTDRAENSDKKVRRGASKMEQSRRLARRASIIVYTGTKYAVKRSYRASRHLGELGCYKVLIWCPI